MKNTAYKYYFKKGKRMLFDEKELNGLRPEYFEEYISFDDNFPYAVRILDENNKEVDMKVFSNKIEAINFIKDYNR